MDGRLFSIYVDNLPLSVTNAWLWKLITNEGNMVDVFVSRKKRLNMNYLFGFVRFSREEEARYAIRRNNGLEVKGHRSMVTMSKYTKTKVNLQQVRLNPITKQRGRYMLAHICSEDEVLVAQEVREKVQQARVENLIVSRLDDYSIILSKKVEGMEM